MTIAGPDRACQTLTRRYLPALHQSQLQSKSGRTRSAETRHRIELPLGTTSVACHFAIREAMRTKTFLEAEVSMTGVDAGNIVIGPIDRAVTLAGNGAPAETETRKTHVVVNRPSGTIGGLAFRQVSTAIGSATQTMNRSNLDGLGENPPRQVVIATLCLVLVGKHQVLVANHDIGGTAEVTPAEAMAAVEEDREMNGVAAVEADRCAVDPGTGQETGPETDQDGLVMIDETQEVTSEAQAGSGGVTFQKCHRTTEISDLDVRIVLYTVHFWTSEESWALARTRRDRVFGSRHWVTCDTTIEPFG